MAMRRPEPGFWTYDDLLAMPEDGRRYEIVEGMLHEMTGPTWEHGTAIHNLVTLLTPFVRAIGGLLRQAPQDVFFPGADPVQPDVFAILPGNPGKRGRRGFEGVPDLVIEVLSPSTRGHDALTKRALYGRAGVREYWPVDPDARSVEILALDGDVLRHAWRGAGDDGVRSRLLPDIAFPVGAIVDDPDLG
jgi:Uma2 family endonuclease